MTAEKLYYLVHSLTRDQKSNFTRYIKGGKKSLDLVLYERILSQKKYNEKAAGIIRGKEFRQASKYYLYRIKLAERIIQSLVAFENNKVSALSYIRRAVTMDAVELAEKTLIEEMLSAQKREDYATLRYLYDFAAALEQDYNINFTHHQDLIPRETVRRWDEVQHQLERLLGQIRMAFRQGETSREMAAGTIAHRLSEYEKETRKSVHLAKKVKIGVALLKREVEEAQELQKELVKGMEASEIAFTTARLTREMATLIMLSEDVGDRETALRYTMTSSNLTPRTLIEQREFFKESILRTIRAADFWANLNLAEKGLIDFEENHFQFTGKEKALSYLELGLCFFHNEKYAEALHCIQSLRSIPAKEWGKITWEPDALMLLCHLEKGNIDVLDSLGRSAYRNARKHDAEYPKAVIRIIHQIMRAERSSLTEIYAKGQKEIDLIFASADERRGANYFNFGVWLQAKLDGCTSAELLSQSGKINFQRMRIGNFGT